MYQERFYRKHIQSKFKLEVSYKASDLLISSDQELKFDFVKQVLVKYYQEIEEYIKKRPDFLNSLSPIACDSNAPAIAQEMIEASRLSGTGPFSSVAGAVSFYLGKELLAFAEEVVVENGGDIFLKINSDKRLGIYLGEKFKVKNIILKIKSCEDDFGIASSSAQIGHSLNFGKADLVTVVANNSIVADSFATSLSNQIHKESDALAVIESAKRESLLKGLLIAFEGKLFLWGDLEIAR